MRSFNLEPGEGFTWFEACIAEVLYTAMLCFVVLNVAAASKVAGNQYYGLAIGFVIVAGGYAVGPISGAALNPAVALGVDAAHAIDGGTFVNSIAYCLMELF